MQQNEKEFQYYLWDRMNVNVNCKVIKQSAMGIINQNDTFVYPQNDERDRYIGGT